MIVSVSVTFPNILSLPSSIWQRINFSSSFMLKFAAPTDYNKAHTPFMEESYSAPISWLHQPSLLLFLWSVMYYTLTCVHFVYTHIGHGVQIPCTLYLVKLCLSEPAWHVLLFCLLWIQQLVNDNVKRSQEIIHILLLLTLVFLLLYVCNSCNTPVFFYNTRPQVFFYFIYRPVLCLV